MRAWRSVVVLSGGVGGARLVHGLAAVLPAHALTAIVNTGDDFEHWGLTICPDLDTVMYTLSGLAHEARGWGLANETFQALAMVQRLGGPGWFQLGDRDLGTHVVRTEALRQGQSLSAITARLCRALGMEQRILPMADQPRRTRIDTPASQASQTSQTSQTSPISSTPSTSATRTLPFQDWFVRERCQPAIARIWFEGGDQPGPEVIDAIASAELVIIGPSNPYVSIDPIMTLRGVAEAMARKPVIAVSPIVGGKAVKGPLAEMIVQLTGKQPSAAAVMEHYRERYGDIVRGAVIEHGDHEGIAGPPHGPRLLATRAIMSDVADRARLAREVLAFGESLA
jgi:LPPG:FO 2-phospho-L-lactate transferase